jgi:hypothetical protein
LTEHGHARDRAAPTRGGLRQHDAPHRTRAGPVKLFDPDAPTWFWWLLVALGGVLLLAAVVTLAR